MCAFYHKPDEKLHAENETEAFYDPFIEEYGEEGLDQEYEDEWNSEKQTPKSRHSNTNTNTNNISQEYEENDSATKPESKFSPPTSDNFTFEDGSEENVWANEEFGLEAALQKTHSHTQKEDFDTIYAEQEPSKEKKSTIDIEPLKEEKKVKSEILVKPKADPQTELVSSEIRNIVLGNSQQMTTATIVEKIVHAPSTGRSKFFNFCDEGKENDEDLISDILNMDYNTFCQENSKPKSANTSTLYPYQEHGSLYVIHEEGELIDSNLSIPSLSHTFSG